MEWCPRTGDGSVSRISDADRVIMNCLLSAGRIGPVRAAVVAGCGELTSQAPGMAARKQHASHQPE